MNIAHDFREFVGDTDYFKFVGALHGVCKKKQRLLFWQERVLGKFYAESGANSLGIAELQAAFPFEAPPIPSIEETIPFYLRELKATGIEQFAGSHEIVRHVSKLGDLSAHCPLLSALEPHLSDDEVYRLRNSLFGSGRPEWEWRPSFCILFGRRLGVYPHRTDARAQQDAADQLPARRDSKSE